MSQKIPLTLGFANLSDGDFGSLLADDVATLSPLFDRVRIAPPRELPEANVLFLYAKLSESGAIAGAPISGLRQIVQTTHAAIVVLASPNPSADLNGALGSPGAKKANIAFTLDRKGPAFGKFWRALFEKMRDGEPMLQAWVHIAPQGPIECDGNPDAVLLPEAGEIAFPPHA